MMGRHGLALDIAAEERNKTKDVFLAAVDLDTQEAVEVSVE